MSTLTELVLARCDLGQQDLDWLHRLVGEWQLVADLSFADLVLHVRTPPGRWLTVAHMRPTTGPTTSPEDLVGTLAEPSLEQRLERAYRDGRIDREGEPEQRSGGPVKVEAVPVRRGEARIAVLTRETSLGATRMPSPLELAYLTSAGELLQMVAEGTFPYPQSGDVSPENAPRAGDGLLRLDGTGHVVYASPNALSASRRLGVPGDLLGAHLGHTIARLSATGPDGKDEPRGSAAVAATLRFAEPRESEVEGQGATVLIRAMPLVPGGQRRGALVLMRDVTELRRRDRQLMGKDATIREIHHRVKNNLQTVAALLRLQARRMTDPAARSALEESVRRVSSIALVHETLSLTLEETVAFDVIADRVLAMCAEVAGPESAVRVERRGSFGSLSAEVATPLSMVLTELVQNAAEHAFPDGGGQVLVLPGRRPGALDVLVADDGRGLPEGFDLAGSGRLGLTIVRTLVEGEMQGTLRLRQRKGGGTEVALEVPVAD